VRLVYLVHNLNDPAVEKRVSMLKAGGVDTLIAGFWRGEAPPADVAGIKPWALGKTKDAAFAARAFASVKNATANASLARKIGHADVLMARNLEMLAIATGLAGKFKRRPAIVYEVLDIHRLMLSNKPWAVGLRSFERFLLRDVDVLVTSSPGFLREYFDPLQFARSRPDVALVENKILSWTGATPARARADLVAGPPWYIGWFGMIRCRRSLEILSNLARRRPDLLRVEIHGRPTGELTEALEKVLPSTPGLTFGGAYTPTDLPELYGGMHFSWSIDYFEADTNSRWLLPNRIYEGGPHNVVPLAVRGTETGRWLDRFGLGVLMDAPERELEGLLEQLTPQSYAALKRASMDAPRSAFVADQSDCDRLRGILSNALWHRSGATSVGKRLPARPTAALESM